MLSRMILAAALSGLLATSAFAQAPQPEPAADPAVMAKQLAALEAEQALLEAQVQFRRKKTDEAVGKIRNECGAPCVSGLGLTGPTLPAAAAKP